MASGSGQTQGGGRQGRTGDPGRQLAGAAQLQPNLMKKHAPKRLEFLILKKEPEIKVCLFFFHGKPDAFLNVGS